MTVQELLQKVESLLERATVAGSEVSVVVNDSEEGYSPVDQIELSVVLKDGDRPDAFRLIIHSEASE